MLAKIALVFLLTEKRAHEIRGQQAHAFLFQEIQRAENGIRFLLSPYQEIAGDDKEDIHPHIAARANLR